MAHDSYGEFWVLSRFEPLPSLVVAHYLGVPREDRSAFDRWTNAIVAVNVAANAAGDVASAPNAALDLFEYATQLIEPRRFDPGDDLVSDLVRAGDDKAASEWYVRRYESLPFGTTG